MGLQEVARPHIAWGEGNIRIIREQWPEQRCAQALDYVSQELVARSAEAGENILEELLDRYERSHPLPGESQGDHR